MKISTFLSLGQAAIIYKKSKSTLSKDLKSGKLSYKEKGKSGYKIDKSELDRVYGIVNVEETPKSNDSERSENTDFQVLKIQIAAKEQLIERMQYEIDELKSRTVDISADRDSWKEQATSQTRLLEHQSSKKGWFNFGRNSHE